jgi:REP element-mobilizing transposase RayT
MGRRARKRHVQTSFAAYSKPLDKNDQLRGARKGEKRKGVGRPKKGLRASERHTKREFFRQSEPVHVIMRAHPDVGSLRKGEVFRAICEALVTVWKLEDSFHVVQFSVQRTHIHMLVEARDRLSLAKGMQTFGISAAKHINALIVDAEGRRRRGSVFPDRYHVRILKKPRQVRNCLSYVLRGSTKIHHPSEERLKLCLWPPRTRLLQTATMPTASLDWRAHRSLHLRC